MGQLLSLSPFSPFDVHRLVFAFLHRGDGVLSLEFLWSAALLFLTTASDPGDFWCDLYLVLVFALTKRPLQCAVNLLSCVVVVGSVVG